MAAVATCVCCLPAEATSVPVQPTSTWQPTDASVCLTAPPARWVNMTPVTTQHTWRHTPSFFSFIFFNRGVTVSELQSHNLFAVPVAVVFLFYLPFLCHFLFFLSVSCSLYVRMISASHSGGAVTQKMTVATTLMSQPTAVSYIQCVWVCLFDFKC